MEVIMTDNNVIIPESMRELKIYQLDEFLNMSIEERHFLLYPIIPEKGLVMLYAKRGVGKTFVSLAIACAIATGKNLLRWENKIPEKVLYIDGEMPAREVQKRLQAIVNGMQINIDDLQNLQILNMDMQETISLDLRNEESRNRIMEHLDGVKLLILDNLSCLSTIKENDADEWNVLQQWLLELRRKGIAVLIVHHAGKSGNQRGSSKKEDIMDTVILLEKPSDYNASQGARFIVKLEKSRNVAGDIVENFEAALSVQDGILSWTTTNKKVLETENIKMLLENKKTIREIADITKLSKTKVGRIKKEIENN